MNKAARFVWEFIGLILTLMGIIGMVQSASEFMYRRQPNLDFTFQPDFLALIRTENDREFFKQLVHPDLNFGIEETPEQALNDLSQIVDHYPAYVKGYYFRGQVYLSMGHVQDGIADMQVVLEQSKDLKLRRQARTEIILARLAKIVTPIPFLGLAAVALVIIADFIGIKVFSSLRSIKVFIVAFIILVFSFIFLLLH